MIDRPRLLALAAAAALSACASSGAAGAGDAPPPAAAGKPRAAAVPVPPPPPGTAPASGDPAVRAFEDAARAQTKALEGGGTVDWSEAERRWRSVLAQGEVGEARFNLGVALEHQGRADEAREAYEQALQAKPTLRQAMVNLAVLAEARGDGPGAAAAYARVLRDFPEDAMARERLASLYLASGQYEESFRLAKESLLRDPRSVGALKTLARAALGKKQPAQARLVARRAEKLAPKDPELPELQGLSYAQQGDAAAAAVQFRRALALAPGHLPARYALLQQALEGQKWGAVDEHATAILAARPDDARVVLAKGLALRHSGKADEALAAYERAEKLGGADLPEATLARGVLLGKVKGECEAAIPVLTAYLRSGGVPAGGPQATKLVRECEATLAENRKLAETARQMKAESDRKAAEAAQKKAAEELLKAPPPPPPQPPSPAPAGKP
ncbi:MAG: adventurous gliding motility TPR repeat lipoprotein GltE [Anaeromyxobacteraceae bacterium]